ncbi:MAG: low molecular weight phosphatase family protein [Actinomycetota bacterium]
MKPTVLFVCVHNAGRSRIAEAYFNQMAGDRYLGISAGTQPADRPHPEVVKALQREGLEIPSGPGRLLTAEMAEGATRVIGMGCNVEEACPALTVPLEDWGIDDPKGQPEAQVQAISRQIKEKVTALITELDRA